MAANIAKIAQAGRKYSVVPDTPYSLKLISMSVGCKLDTKLHIRGGMEDNTSIFFSYFLSRAA